MLLYQQISTRLALILTAMCWFCCMCILFLFSTTILSDLHASRSQCDWHSPRLKTSCVLFVMMVVLTSNLIEWSCSQYDWHSPRLQIFCALFVMVVVLMSDLIEWSCSGSQCDWHSPRLQICCIFFVMVVVLISDLIEWSCSRMQPIRPRSVSQRKSWLTKQLWQGPWLTGITRSSGHGTIVTRAMNHQKRSSSGPWIILSKVTNYLQNRVESISKESCLKTNRCLPHVLNITWRKATCLCAVIFPQFFPTEKALVTTLKNRGPERRCAAGKGRIYTTLHMRILEIQERDTEIQ